MGFFVDVVQDKVTCSLTSGRGTSATERNVT
jgi:hypothetical protein